MSLVELRKQKDSKLEFLNVLVLNCVAFGAIGGAERRLVEMARHFLLQGIRPHIIEYSEFSLDYGNNGEHIILVSRMFPEHIMGDILRSIYLTITAFRICLKTRIDAIYVNRVDSLESIISAFLISKVLIKPFIMIIHHISFERKYTIKSSIEFWVARGVSTKGIIQRFAAIIIRRYIHAHADICISVTQNTANEVRELINPKILYVSGNGVDGIRFTPDFKAEKKYDACYLGRIDRFKGIEVLIKCWKIIVEKFPKSILLLIGDGPYTDHYKSLVKQFRLEDNVIFTGWVKDEYVIHLLRSSKLFLFCSTWEGRPLAVSEAMACGLCCIISDIPALRENFDGAADFVNPHNPQEFAKRTIHYLMYEDERTKMGFAAYKKAQSFSWDAVAHIEASIIKAAVKRR